MCNCPYFSARKNNYFRGTLEEPSYIRILHAVPGAPAVDIYVNNAPILRNIAYKQFSNYIPITTGTYNIKIYAAGTTANPVVNTNLFIPAFSIITLAAIGRLPNVSILSIADKSDVPLHTGKAEIRFIHLSPDTSAVNVTLPNGKILFQNISYKQIQEYVSVDPGVYTLQLKDVASEKVVLHVPNIKIRPRNYYTIYTVGLASGNPPLQALIPLDGNTYLKV